MVDLQEHSIDDTGERSCYKNEDLLAVWIKRLMTVDETKEVCRNQQFEASFNLPTTTYLYITIYDT